MNSNLPLSLERNVFSQCVLPVLAYSAKTWRLTKDFERRPSSAQSEMERKIMGITWRDRKPHR